MNICQISSYDLLLCLQSGNLEQSPFFQQVFAIAGAGHLVCISDYAIEAFLQAQLPNKVQQQLDSLLDMVDIWATSPQTHQQADELSQTLAIPLADAIDHGIYEHLCPDWLLVEEVDRLVELGRSLPNAASIQEFWQDWRSIQDDLPPSDGIPMGKFPTGGGGSPNDAPSQSNQSSQSQKIAAEANLLAANSVVFSHRNFVNWSMGLYYVSHPKPIATPVSTQSAAPTTTDWIASDPAFQAKTQKLNPSNPANRIRVVIAADGQTPTIKIEPIQAAESSTVYPSDDNANPQTVPPFKQLVLPPESWSQASPEVLAAIAQTVQNLTSQNQVLQGTPKNDVLIAQAGNDVLIGGAGADFLDGGAGVDTASYAQANSGVTVSLATGLGSDGEAKGDRLKNIENLEGSNFADTLVGDRGDNVLIGRAGNDTIVGGLGNDILQGGTGNNRLFGDGSTVNGSTVDGSTVNGFIVDSNNGNGITIEIDGSFTAAPTTQLINPPAITTPNQATDPGDWIFAGDGDDVIDAGDGNNFIDAGAGNNLVASGNGQDLFVLCLGAGVTTIVHYQHHDRFGLVGGVAYEDLSISAIAATPTGLQPDAKLKVKISINRNGVEDILAIVVGITPTDLTRDAFLTIQYQLQPPQNSGLQNSGLQNSGPQNSGPQILLNSGSQGMTQVIPDWLNASQRSGNILQVPTIGQLAPNLVVLGEPSANWAA